MAWDPAWEKVFKENAWGKYPGEDLIRFIAKNFYGRKRETTRILEVGCGAGANLWYLAREGFDVYGIDGSPSAVERARELLDSEGLKAELTIGDAASLPYADAYFEGVIEIECLYANSREDTRKILAEAARVLKDDGLFYSRTLGEGTYTGRSSRKIGQAEYTDVSDGPLAGKGIARLSSEAQARQLYGEFFSVVSVDRLELTFNNGSLRLNELSIICRKLRS